MPQVKEITSLAQFKEIINSETLSFVDFWAAWCGPCRFISPKFEEHAEKATGDVAFYKVNVDDVPDVAEECGIRAMPTFIAFKNGQKVQDLVGANPTGLQNLVSLRV